MTGRFQWIAIALVLAVLASRYGPTGAQASGGRALQEVAIEDQCIVVGFSFPVQYVRHFPADTGDEIRIRVRPRLIGRSGSDSLFGRETARPPKRHRVHLSDVVFEGDGAGGPHLLVRFDQTVNFRVSVGSDFRSIVVFVGEKGADAKCFPK